MTRDLDYTILGLGDTESAFHMMMLVVNDNGGLQQARTVALQYLYDYVQMIVHVETGKLKEAITMQPQHNVIWIDDEVIKMEGSTAQYPAEYGIYEHNRGGTHAFFQRAVDEAGPAAGRLAQQYLMGALEAAAGGGAGGGILGILNTIGGYAIRAAQRLATSKAVALAVGIYVGGKVAD